VTILFTDNTRTGECDGHSRAVEHNVPVRAFRKRYCFPGNARGGRSAYVAILDNGMNTHLTDIAYDKWATKGINNFFDLWDDESATIEHFNNNAISLNHAQTGRDRCLFGRKPGRNQIAPVITLRDSTSQPTAPRRDGLQLNGLYVENTVLQPPAVAGVCVELDRKLPRGISEKYLLGKFGGRESGFAGAFSVCRDGRLRSDRRTTTRRHFRDRWVGGVQGWFASGGSGSTHYSYFIVANDTTAAVTLRQCRC